MPNFVNAMNHRKHVFLLTVNQEQVGQLLGIKVNNPVVKSNIPIYIAILISKRSAVITKNKYTMRIKKLHVLVR